MLYRTFEADRSFYLCTAVISFFPFESSSTLLSDPDLWQFVSSELGKDAMLDMCMPKPRGEVLVIGRCFAPGGKPVPACEVRLQMGLVDKTLYVFGDRFWRRKGGILKTISDPLPFTEMDISYENAFGGPDYKKNPLGKGHAPVKSDTGETVHPLPNIEDPRDLIDSPKNMPDPAGFAPIDLTWPQRMDKVGTYDQKWLEELFPGLAADMDPTYFNTAPEDQWMDAFFKGDELFEIKGMHPGKIVLQARLPGIKSRCFMNQKNQEGEAFKEIKTSLDTVWLFPHAEKGIILWRGVTEIQTDDAEDILHMLVAYERINEEPRSLEHYRQALLKRLDEEKGALYMLDEKDLIPPGEKSGLAALIGDIKKEEDALSRNMKKKAEKEKEKAEKKKQEAMKKMEELCEKHGLDPKKVIPPPPPPHPKMPEIDPNNLNPDEIMRFMKQAEADAMARKEKAMADAMARKEQAEKKIRELCDKQGLDFDKVMAKLQAEKPKRPVFSADKTVEKLKKAKETIEKQVNEACARLGIDYDTAIAQAKEQPAGKTFPIIEAVERVRKLDPDDPEMLEKLKLAEEKSKEAYKKTAHHLPKPEPLSPEEADRLKHEFLAMHAQGQRFEGKDFAGVDLSGMDLQKADLRGIYLEGANLSGADLTGADLSGAVLAWADLSGAKLNSAKMQETCLASANLTNTEVKDADLTEGVLSKSNLTGADFSGTTLDKVELMEATFGNTNLSNTSLAETIFLETDFSEADFSGADLTGTNFIKPKLDGVNFSGAKAEGVNFIEASCEKAVFKKADLTNARFPKNANLKRADFTGAVLDNANLMEADLTQASFGKASLNNANLMKANFNKADLTGITARKASLMKADLSDARVIGANLMEANLKSSKLVRTDLRMANLYGAEVMRAVVGKTDFRRANLKMTKIADWRPGDKGRTDK
ncbi:MAG: DUF2169 domain-containing protein [candidate division Zixibacteria bacterium]|nr:DUF2169 domain-containing protein [candidate division Zixibacteria bacterium]